VRQLHLLYQSSISSEAVPRMRATTGILQHSSQLLHQSPIGSVAVLSDEKLQLAFSDTRPLAYQSDTPTIDAAVQQAVSNTEPFTTGCNAATSYFDREYLVSYAVSFLT